MKALELQKYGEGDHVLSLVEKPVPEPGPGEVRVRILYSPLNPSDIYNTLRGTYRDALSNAIWNYGKKDHLFVDPGGQRELPVPPMVPGLEAMGIVEKAGGGAYAKYLVGKRVSILGGNSGNWQEYNIVPALQAIPLSRDISDEQGAMNLVNPLTACAMLLRVLRLRKGQWLMQSAASSEVGKMVIRLAHQMGVNTINIVRHADQKDALLELGANHVIVWGKENLREKVHLITMGKGVPAILDPVAGKMGSEMTACLGLNGRMLVYGTLSNEPLKFSSRNLMTPVASIQGFFLTNYMLGLSKISRIRLIRQTMKLIRAGVFRSDLAEVFPLEEYRKALKAAQKPGHTGKILFRVSS